MTVLYRKSYPAWALILLFLAAPPNVLGADDRFTAVLADVHGTVHIYRADGSGPSIGNLGRRLRVGDTVETGADSAASIFLSGGQLIEILGGSRVRITRDLASDTERTAFLGKLSAPSLKTLESGVWILSDPKGSLLVGALRGGKNEPARAGPLLLSPRNELALERMPTFFWSGTSGSVRVVVGSADDVVWRSTEIEASHLHYPEDAPALGSNADYQWWLESSAEGSVLTDPSTFHIASQDTADSIADFETAMGDLAQSVGDDRVTGFLRCAYYAKLDAWSEALKVVDQLSDHDDTSEFAGRAMISIAEQMSLRKSELLDLRALRAVVEAH